MRARVFVSSVVDGFEAFRQAAREGIIAAGGEPVLVNEDFPSLTMSSRNACLDAVDSSDILISLIGARGGYITPSGKLVVEEEYERAVARKRPVLVFLQNTARDDSAVAFTKKLSDYIDGAHRRTFTTVDDLSTEIERALIPLVDVPCLAICRCSLTGSAPLVRDAGSRSSAGSTSRRSAAIAPEYRI